MRCTVVTRAQPHLDEDRDVFRTLGRHHRRPLRRFGQPSPPAAPSASATRPASRRGSSRTADSRDLIESDEVRCQVRFCLRSRLEMRCV